MVDNNLNNIDFFEKSDYLYIKNNKEIKFKKLCGM